MLTECSICHTTMFLISSGMSMPRELFMQTEGCYKCRACGRCTCYKCSDNRKPCLCGQQQWAETSYLPKQP
jgi:hypothetical protein